jgi:hypothetical protein
MFASEAMLLVQISPCLFAQELESFSTSQAVRDGIFCHDQIGRGSRRDSNVWCEGGGLGRRRSQGPRQASGMLRNSLWITAS